jgi:putative transposase
MSNEYVSKNRCKFLLRYHLIFVCKYRRKLLGGNNVSSDIKKLSEEIANKHDVKIKYMETDKDHIHYMIETTPNINLSDFVRGLKQYTTYHIWEKYEPYLSKCFWHERTFWSDGYFIASIGEVSSQTLQYYIENQGKK